MEMAYKNRFSVCVLVDGQIMKELPDGSVGLPFGSEYTLRLFNKHDRRAVAKIYIDEENVSEGGFVIDAHGKVDISRRADRDSAFRFVELGSDAALLEGKPAHDPDGEMGVIKVDFHLEKPHKAPTVARPLPITWPNQPYQPAWPNTMPYRGPLMGGQGQGGGTPFGSFGDRLTSTSGTHGVSGTAGPLGGAAPLGGSHNIRSCSLDGVSRTKGIELHSVSETADASPVNEDSSTHGLSDGCTVEGQATGQAFETEYVDYEFGATTLMLYLQGYKQRVNVVPRRKKRVRKTR